MKLKFGDLQSKSDGEAAAKFEVKVRKAEEAIRRLATLPPEHATIREFPPVIQSLGLEACRAALRRVRESR